jgi:serine phosphatase RsbU (regulator of sigma subunit)
MAGIRDWWNLAERTVRSFERDDVRQLYSIEWPEAKRRLIAEHAEAIGKEKQRGRKLVRTGSALLYGLALRLAPQRRIVFLLALIGSVASLFFLSSDQDLASQGFAILGLSFLAMTLLLALELIDKIKFRDELELARDLQAGLIPKEPPTFGDFEIDAFNQIANTVGGDIYDFVPLPDGRLAILFGDASGHGMAAGLVMAVAHAAFRTQIDVDPAPEAVFATMNRILCRTGGPRAFFAGTYFLLSADGAFKAVIAGHPPILIIDDGGNVRRRIGVGAYPLGVKQTAAWKLEEGSVGGGESLLFYSDGLVEARDPAGQDLGYERFVSFVEKHGKGKARQILYGLIGEFRSFCMRPVPEDDVSIAVIQRACLPKGKVADVEEETDVAVLLPSPSRAFVEDTQPA